MPDYPMPKIDWFPVDGADAAVAVMPGGGYGNLADHEGAPVARWLNTLGLSAAVVYYRHAPDHRHPTPLRDALAGVTFCREHVRTVGILGFSAGGHLAATTSTVTDDELRDAGHDATARPDFSVLCYPVIDLAGAFAHVGSRQNLLGEDAGNGAAETLSAHRRVTKQTPPAFIFHTVADEAVPVENALLYAGALRSAGVPFALHVTDDSANPGHGCGMAEPGGVRPDPLNHTWTHHCAAWLRSRGWATR